MKSSHYSLQILMKVQFSRQSVDKSRYTKFYQNLPCVRRVVACGLTDGQTDMTNLIVAFRNFTDAP
jgi:hypothetical protein